MNKIPLLVLDSKSQLPQHDGVEVLAERADPVANTPFDQRGRSLHDLRISLIDRCNFRCPYCMPAEKVSESDFLPSSDLLTPDEIETIARAFVSVGVRKIRLTGGEPLLRKDLGEIVSRLAKIEQVQDLALTTNGVLLAAQATALKAAGLQRITVSLDSLDPEVFGKMSGQRGKVQSVLDGIAAAENAGFSELKINVVVMRGVNDHTILDLLSYFRGTPHIVRMIEYMDVGNCNQWQNQEVLPSAELRARIHARWPLRALDANYRGEVCTRYAYDDGLGEIGFVSSVSAPFCGDCHRARVGADGRFYTCLFAGAGHDLRVLLRESNQSKQDLETKIAGLWSKRDDRYSEIRAALRAQNASGKHIEMFQIGG